MFHIRILQKSKHLGLGVISIMLCLSSASLQLTVVRKECCFALNSCELI